MHRTSRRPWVLLGALIALLLGGLSGVSHAQIGSPESRPLVVLIGSATRLQMSTRKPIKTVLNPKEGLVNIRTVEGDPTVVLLIGVASGVTRIELQDADGNRELREIIVQADVEYLNRQLKRAVPLSGIQVIPNGASGVILTGYVQRAEDINVAQQVAQSVGFTVINGLRLNGVQQVQLDVVIARVNRTKGRSFGFNFIGNARQTIYGSSIGNLIPINQQVGVPGSLLTPSQFGTQISVVPGAANLFGGIIGNAAGFLAFLQALETEGLAKLMAQPRLVTLSGNPASFLDGGEQAIPVPAGLGQVGVQFEEFGTRLNFLPVVLGNGRIHLEVEPEVSNLDAAAGTVISGATVPGRVTQRIHTTVEMESGQTYVIGGLIQKTSSGGTNKFPVLGQIPFLGAAFSTKTASTTETELVVLVTPHLVDAQSSCQVAKILPGQESRNPDDFELFLEGILEAPRGPRAIFQGARYVPPHRTGPTACIYPCAGQGDGIHTQPIGFGTSGGKAGSICPPGIGCATNTGCVPSVVKETTLSGAGVPVTNAQAPQGQPQGTDSYSPATTPTPTPANTGAVLPTGADVVPAQNSGGATGTEVPAQISERMPLGQQNPTPIPVPTPGNMDQ